MFVHRPITNAVDTTATGRYLVVLGDNRGLTASALFLHSDLQIVY